jgi:hypothetical protein
MKTTNNHVGRSLESREDVPTLLSPDVAPDLHITMAMRCCVVLEQNGTMLQQFWLFTVKSRPHLILQE